MTENVEKPTGIDNIKNEIREIIPSAFNEGVLDVEKLRDKICIDDTVSESNKYEFNWAGKQNALQEIKSQTNKTLRPDYDKSINYDETNNLFIEGDNLESLKIIQNSYHKSVKMIYIDPPYNTGNDFIYKDDFKQDKSEYEKETGQRNKKGNKLVSNPKSNGRHHSDWLSMMYPRLFYARKLLKEDGILTVSIDTNEKHHLRMILDDLFGSENLLAELVWKRGAGSTNGHFMQSHEYILVYAKNKSKVPYFKFKSGLDNLHDFDSNIISERAIKKISTKNPASEITFPAGIEIEGVENKIFKDKIEGTEEIIIMDDEMKFENGELAKETTLKAGWAMKNQIKSWIKNGVAYDTRGQKVKRFFFSNTGKLQYEKERGTIHPSTVIDDWTTQDGTRAIESLFNEDVEFSYPKPVGMLKQLIHLMTEDDDIIMDFFAGSATTAQAVMELNSEHDSKRNYILVQIPEELENKNYNNICELSFERIKRASNKIHNKIESDINIGCKYFTVSESNFSKWSNPENINELENQLSLETKQNKIKNKYHALFEVICMEGFKLNSDIKKHKINNQELYDIRENEKNMIVTFENINLDTINKLSIESTTKIICLDDNLTDTQKDNLSRHYKVKVI